MESSRIICHIKLHENLIEVGPEFRGSKYINSFMTKEMDWIYMKGTSVMKEEESEKQNLEEFLT